MSEKGKNRFSDIFRSFLPGNSLTENSLTGNDPAASVPETKDTPSGSDQRTEGLFECAEPIQLFETADRLNNAALSLMKAGKVKEAERLWEAALLKDPCHADSFFNRTLHRLRRGQLTPREAYLELEGRDFIRQAGLHEEIARECGTCPAPVTSRTFQVQYKGTFNEAGQLQALVVGKELRFLYKSNHLTSIDIYDLESNQEIPSTNMGVRREGKGIRCGAFQPGSSCYAAVIGTESLVLFDYEQSRILSERFGLGIHRRTIDEFTRIRFSPDGSLIAVSEPAYQDRRHPRTILLRSRGLEAAADLDMQFVCMTRQNECLLIGKSAGKADTDRDVKREALFLAGADGILREAYGFEDRKPEIRVFDQSPAPFICCFSKRTEEYFLLDDALRKFPLTEKIYRETNGTVFYDPEKTLLYTFYDRKTMNLWDLNTLKKLFTYENQASCWDGPYDKNVSPSIVLAGAKRDGNGWNLTTLRSQFIGNTSMGLYWSHLHLPGWQMPQGAVWRISPEQSDTERREMRIRAERLREQFYTCMRGSDPAGALAAYREYREIPGVYATKEQEKMEAAVDTAAEKHAVHRVRAECDLPEVPTFSLGKRIRYSECPGEILALCQLFDKGAIVQLFRRDGSLIRQMILPDPVRFAAVRGERIFAFRDGKECLLWNLEGEALPLPWEDWPQEKVYYDLSRDGRFLLYCEESWTGTGASSEIRMKDLETGMETLFPVSALHYMKGTLRILDDRNVLFKDLKGRDGLVCHDARTGAEKKSFMGDYCEGYAIDEDRGLVIAAAEQFRNSQQEALWKVFDGEGNLLHEWHEECHEVTSFILLPHTSLVVYIVKKVYYPSEDYELRIRDYLDGRLLLSEPVDQRAQVFARPDGREIYTAVGNEAYSWKRKPDGKMVFTRDSKRVRLWALEYDYEIDGK